MTQMLTDIETSSLADPSKFDLNGDALLDAGELEELLRRTHLWEHFTVKVRCVRRRVAC
jgi:hypothetical protein